ncbi:hypothetical protein MASR1M65_05550 [Saprospiraceae bacterium]
MRVPGSSHRFFISATLMIDGIAKYVRAKAVIKLNITSNIFQEFLAQSYNFKVLKVSFFPNNSQTIIHYDL